MNPFIKPGALEAIMSRSLSAECLAERLRKWSPVDPHDRPIDWKHVARLFETGVLPSRKLEGDQ